MRSNRTNCDVMLDSPSSWLLNASIQSDFSKMQTRIRLLIHMCCHRFYHMSWSKLWHPISSTRCINTVIKSNIVTFLGKSIWSQTSTRHLFKCIDMNQSWNKVSMHSSKNHHLLRARVCLGFVSPIWLTIVALLQLCFLEHPLLNSIFPCYVRRRMSSLRCCPILSLREFCRWSNICLLNNFLSPICKTCPSCLPPKLTFQDKP